MKQKDFALVAVIIILSAVISVVVSNIFLGSSKKRQQKVEVVDQIQTDFEQPDPKYFNENAIDPTKLITIGENPNNTPFKDNN